MKLFVSIFLCGFLTIGSAFASPITDFDVQDWWAPGELGMLLYNAKKNFPEMRVSQDDHFDGGIDSKGSYCFMRISFPRDRTIAARSERNHLTCYLRDTGGNYAILTLDLQEVEVMAWGNRPTYEYWEREGLPKVFQFVNQKINDRIFAAMEAASQTDTLGDFIKIESDCGSQLRYCQTRAYFINVADSKRSSTYFRCQLNFENKVQSKNQCIFFYPDAH